MSEQEPAEGGLVALEAPDVERVADGDRVEASLHHPGDERGDIERTAVDVKCVNGLPDPPDTTRVLTYGIAAGTILVAVAMEITGASGDSAAIFGAGLTILGVVLAFDLAGRVTEEVSGE